MPTLSNAPAGTSAASPGARRPDWVGSALLAVSAYELAADVVNDALDERLLPSVVGGVRRFNLWKILRTPMPPWLRKALMFAVAGAVGAVTNSAHGYREASRQKTASPSS